MLHTLFKYIWMHASSTGADKWVGPDLRIKTPFVVGNVNNTNQIEPSGVYGAKDDSPSMFIIKFYSF